MQQNINVAKQPRVTLCYVTCQSATPIGHLS